MSEIEQRPFFGSGKMLGWEKETSPTNKSILSLVPIVEICWQEMHPLFREFAAGTTHDSQARRCRGTHGWCQSI